MSTAASAWSAYLPSYGFTTDHTGRTLKALIPPYPNPRFVPCPTSIPLPIWAAIIPPLTYYLALMLLPPFDEDSGSADKDAIKPAAKGRSKGSTSSSKASSRSSPSEQAQFFSLLKFALAGLSAATFIVLPFWYYVPGSATLSYQLGLVGCYGACRVVDVFFLSWPRVPKRIVVPQPMSHRKLIESEDDRSDKEQKYANADNKKWMTEPLPQSWRGRMWYAFDLMISMRGIGWDYATPDVRHDAHPWQPPSSRQLRRALFKLLPALMICIAILRFLLVQMYARSSDLEHMSIASLPPHWRGVFVVATGIVLYALFDFGYTFVSAFCMPALRHGEEMLESYNERRESQASENDSAPARPGKKRVRRLSSNAHNVDFFPLLNPIKIVRLSSLRSFWSKIWHRLFHRAFLIYGVLPVQHLAIMLENLFTHFVLRRPIDGASKGEDAPFLEQLKSFSPARHPDPGRVLPRGRADWGKVMGAFIASGLIHAVSERCALGGRLAQPPPHHLSAPSAGIPHSAVKAASRWTGLGRWSASRLIPSISGGGEFTFFVLNGVAICVEGAIARFVLKRRRSALLRERKRRGEKVDAPISKADLTRPYDAWVGGAWAVLVLAYTGETFVEGWVRSGIIEELTMVSL